MTHFKELSDWLQHWAGDDTARRDIAATLMALAEVGTKISTLVAAGPLAGDQSGIVGENSDGDLQKLLDLTSHHAVIAALADAPVAYVGSEEAEEPISLRPDAALAVAVDPLDGSSNIGINLPMGTIFSILPALAAGGEASFRQIGRSQLAAGFLVYGPMTELALTVGDGTHVFVLDRRDGTFRLVNDTASIAHATEEFAINASNYRHWDETLRAYIDDCLAGDDGVRTKDFNMRWYGSLVAEASRILARGGVFLYPSDQRQGYGEGRLRLVYEANPVAFLVEQAGGAASTGAGAILDQVPDELHQRVPLIFGAREEVERIERYLNDPQSLGENAPLFGRRGLFRA
ncbi:D-fructose 1,6-bisphosphatase [Breoghania corrubedonensis]|uniref:Fructose-1,6-bisphosphatase class 1 n=1 Tax=Breoghania corrubedonensis TaxID=665038 RepID=A0A2T5VB59_9HYPH|nr:class 1 fructose-bisphosphatase [Breoghania corrubedonensis]PTW60984.1 D-fructose 1,6-bisphosphatase [Breoghania corrubedonensis]